MRVLRSVSRFSAAKKSGSDNSRSTSGGRIGAIGANGLQALPERLGLHDHARPPAKGAVVNPPVLAFGKVAQLPKLDLHRPTAAKGAAGHARFQHGAEQLGKQGDDVKTHG